MKPGQGVMDPGQGVMEPEPVGATRFTLCLSIVGYVGLT